MSTDASGDGRPAAERLRELQRLRDDELISDDEFEAQRARILDEAFGSADTPTVAKAREDRPSASARAVTEPLADGPEPAMGSEAPGGDSAVPRRSPLHPERWPNRLRVLLIVPSGVWLITLPFMFRRNARYTWLPYVGVATVVVLLLSVVSGSEGDESGSEATATPSRSAATAAPARTSAPAQTATPSPTATPAQTATPSPTATPAQTATPSPTATPARTPTPAPTPLPWRAAELNHLSVRSALENADDTIRSVSLDEYHSLDITTDGTVVLTYRVESALSETDLLTIGAHTAFSAFRALFVNPRVEGVGVTVETKWIDQLGNTKWDFATIATFERATADLADWSGLEGLVLGDNKRLFCAADAFAIHPAIYTRLGDKGCLLAR